MKNWLESVFSDGSNLFVSNPCPKKGDRICIRMRAYADAPIDHVFLRTKLNGVEMVLPMVEEKVENDLKYFKTEVSVYEDMLHYHFYITSNKVVYYYNQFEITDCLPDESYDFKILVDYDQPEWVKNAVFYQIFPDRFCNGNVDNDVKDGDFYVFGDKAHHVQHWNEAPLEYEEAKCLDFYGGDLEGVTSKLDYLRDLGVSAIYLNPIFSAASVHRYDCLDYFHVDKYLGGDKALEELTKALHLQNMKVILDVSINHTGTAHLWFNRDGQFFDKSIGAFHNPKSLERGFYFFKENNEYKGWFDNPTLPTLNYTSKDLRKVICEGEDSLVKKWLKPPYSIDGWRFDVADTMARNDSIQLHHEIWPAIRKSIKEENKNAYILAEDWCDCAEFLQGKEWDAPMNYFGFSRPVREFVGEQDLHNGRNPLLYTTKPLSAKNLEKRILQHLAKLPFVIQENQFNLLGSHDCSRLHNNPNISYEAYKGAVIMLFSMIGATNIYYGDEINIDGKTNSVEMCRYPMPWDKNFRHTPNYELFKKLAHLKGESSAFKGSFKIISSDERVFSYARFSEEECYVSIICMQDEAHTVKIPTKAFGVKARVINKDFFGLPLASNVNEDDLEVTVSSKHSCLFKL